MKKTFILITAFAAAMLCSCSKENLTEEVQAPSKTGIPASFTIGTPNLEEEVNAEDETKVSGTPSSDTKYSFQWQKGDKIAVFAFELNSTKALNIIDCGDFVAQNGGAEALFTGTLPDTLKKLKWTSLYALANAGETRTLVISDDKRYLIKKVYLNPVQDGDGFKYAKYASTGWTLEYDGNNNPSFKTVTALTLGVPILKFDLSGIGSGNEVYKMVVRLEQANPLTYNQFIAGNLDYPTNKTMVNSGGEEKAITIYNGGQALPSTVYAATRHTAGQSKYGYSSLVTYLYYKDGEGNDKMDVKTIKLATFKTTGEKTDTTCLNFDKGYIYNMPAFPELQDRFVINWVAGYSVPTVFAPAGSSYKAFPYADNSTASKIQFIYDGKGSKTIITPTYGKYYYAPVRNYIFKMGTVETALEMGPATNDTTGYYHYPAGYSYIRTGNCYIKIPAKEGYRLSRVKVGVHNGKTGTITVCGDNLGATTIASVSGVTCYNPVDESFTASQTAANTAYYIRFPDRYVTNFTFEYLPVTE